MVALLSLLLSAGLTFADRGGTSGLRLPHKITATDSKGQIVDEMEFRLIEANPPLSAMEFDVPDR